MPATEREHASGPLGDAEYELLSTANEDLHGLWEAIWGLRTLHGGSGDDAALRQEAEPILRRFLEQGWIELHRERLAPGEVETLAPDEAARALGDPGAWRPPSSTSASYVGFVATPAGRAAWDAAAAARQARPA